VLELGIKLLKFIQSSQYQRSLIALERVTNHLEQPTEKEQDEDDEMIRQMTEFKEKNTWPVKRNREKKDVCRK
jgi:hypothetical protein